MCAEPGSGRPSGCTGATLHRWSGRSGPSPELSEGFRFKEGDSRAGKHGAASRRPIVFLGLSIDATEAAHILDADYRGPVMAGNLDALEPPADVLIIDGMLESGSRLDPAEAERALSRGIRLAGAASLGAVLAGRLEHRGMSGSGEVLEVLRRIEGSHSDLVRALYTADTLRPLTVPLVSALVPARQQGWDDARLAGLADALRAIPADARSWSRIRGVATDAGLVLPADAGLVDFKKTDARQALHRNRR